MVDVGVRDKCTINGIGNIFVLVLAKFRESIVLGNVKMRKSKFYVIDGNTNKYNTLLGYKFLKEIKIIHLEQRMIEKKMGGNGTWEIYNKLWKSREQDFECIEVGEVNDEQMIMIEGSDMAYKVTRSNCGESERM